MKHFLIPTTILSAVIALPLTAQATTFTLAGAQVMEHWATAQDPANTGWYGYSGTVEIRDDFALIGDAGLNSYRGGVEVLIPDGADQWISYATIQDPNGNTGDSFGSAVASDGRFVIVGAPFGDDLVSGNTDVGAVLVYDITRPTAPGMRLPIPASSLSNDEFGASVDIVDADIPLAIVGAPSNDINAHNAGAAFIFYFAGGQWHHHFTILAPTTQTERFGFDVAITANPNAPGGFEVVIGAPYAAGNLGKAYFYNLNPQWSWNWNAVLTGVNSTNGPSFGTSVEIDGDFAVIGSPAESFGSATGYGAAFVYKRGASGWPSVSNYDYRAEGTSTSGNFGVDVDLVRTGAESLRMVVGGPYLDVHGNGSGAAVVFDRSAPGNWTRTEIGPVLHGAYSRFGAGVSINVGQTKTTVLGSSSQNDYAQIFDVDRSITDFTGMPHITSTVVPTQYQFQSFSVDAAHTIDFIVGTVPGNAYYKGVRTAFANPQLLASDAPDAWGECSVVADIGWINGPFGVQAIEIDAANQGVDTPSYPVMF